MTRTVFRGGRVFDGTGVPPASADVVVEDGRIVDVGPGLDGDVSVDLAGRTLLPGLFDCHVHLAMSYWDELRFIHRPFSYQFFEAARNLQTTLRVGITSVRDAWGIDLGVKQALADGLLVGPHVQISLSMVSQTGGHGDTWSVCGSDIDYIPPHPGRPSGVVDGPEEARRKVRELVRAGADVIKIATTGGVLSAQTKPTQKHFRDDELAAIVGEATAADIPVMAHAQGADGIKAALRAGVRSIEHGVYLDEEAIDLMLERGAFLVPTLVAAQGVVDSAAAGAAIPEASVRKAHEVIGIHREAFRRAVAAGVKIAMGTDSPVTPHGQNLRELACMAEGGMPPAAVLRAATRVSAELLGVAENLGTIEPGKIADLIVVSGDPLDFAGYAERVDAVYMDGRLVAGG